MNDMDLARAELGDQVVDAMMAPALIPEYDFGVTHERTRVLRILEEVHDWDISNPHILLGAVRGLVVSGFDEFD